MKYNPDIHHRRSIRIPGYDYSQPGAYFVTICIWQRECLLGEIQDENILLSNYGEVVNFNWFNLIRVYPHIELDSFVIMPNHIHGIIIIKEQNRGHSLSEIVRGFKTFSARRINQIRSVSGIPVWQRGYYEHIIRNETAFSKIQEYIINNPYNWETEEMHPSRQYHNSNKINIKLDNKNVLRMNLLS
ncbi:MAG: transposase [Oscillatoriales cyanobacterium CG2_30_40_61]|nr:MAG: transposase [Oscillatoriales cyanobacterium CG2_30_40_61]